MPFLSTGLEVLCVIKLNSGFMSECTALLQCKSAR